MKRLVLVGMVVAALMRASGAAAQACLGLPSFGAGAVRVNVALELPDSATAVAVGVGAGRHNHLFGNIGGGVVTYEGLDGKSTLGFLELGYQVPLGPAQLCPIAGGYFQVGPDDDIAGLEVTSRAAAVGAAIGLPIGTGTIALIPNAALKYDFFSVKFEEIDVGSTTESASGGVVDLGLALVFRNRFSIQPLIHIPVGHDDDEVSYGVFASLGFGWR